MAQEWPADDYAVGSYIQATAARPYLESLKLNPEDSVLDLGCGNGSFSLEILEKFKINEYVAVDASANMLALAKKTIPTKKYPIIFLQRPIEELDFHDRFDHIVSFWCLQWIHDFKVAFTNIYNALKPGGKLFAILPTGDDYFFQSYLSVKKSGKFSSLNNFISALDYENVAKIDTYTKDIPFTSFVMDRIYHTITLPSLDTFRKFVNGVSFFEEQVPDSDIPLIKDEMVSYYDKICREKYAGEYRFEFSLYNIKAIK